jgi:hypothetical protein
MGAAADCETIGAGFLGQPANALTTIAFVVAGLVVIALRPRRRWVGLGLAATGIGSFLFHGPIPPGSEWAHDVSLVWLVTIVAGTGTRWERLTRLPALLFLAVALALVPVMGDPLGVMMTALAVVTILSRDHSASAVAPLLLLGVVAVYGRLGATAGPLCDPASLFQPHAVWHLGSALAVAWWAMAGTSQTSPVFGRDGEPAQ